MNCENNIQLITRADFDCVGQVAMHCDNTKLCIAINEAQDFDLSELFCEFSEDIFNIWLEVEAYQNDPELPEPDNYDLKVNLLCGGYYDGCSDKRRKHYGIKRILVYYSYARYLIINQNTDTASGTKQKTNEFSIPTPLKEVQSIADRYRTMGYESYKKTMDFLCVNKNVFSTFDNKECKECGCASSDCGKTKAKGYGIKTGIITKG